MALASCLLAHAAMASAKTSDSVGHRSHAESAHHAGQAMPAAGVLSDQRALELPWPKGRQLQVISAAGDVAIRARRGSAAQLTAHKTLGGPHCAASYVWSEHTLAVRAAEPNGSPCAVDLVIAVPPAVAVDVAQQEGTLKLSGIRGALKVALEHGGAVVGGTFASLDVNVGDGSISVQGLAGPGKVHIGSGNLQVFWAPQAKGTLALDLGTGNATLCADAPVDVDASTPSSAHLSNTTQPPGAKAPQLFVTGTVNGRLSVRSSGSS